MKTALIVDDNPTVRAALRKFFENRSDVQVSGEAVDGADAIRRARATSPDLVLMDLVMPNLSGAGAAVVIKRLFPQTRIVIFSLFSDVVGRNMARALDVDVIIDKAEGPSGLTRALDKILAVPVSDPASNHGPA